MFNQLIGLFLRHVVLLVVVGLLVVGVINREAIFGLQSDAEQPKQVVVPVPPVAVPDSGPSQPAPAAPAVAPLPERRSDDETGNDGPAGHKDRALSPPLVPDAQDEPEGTVLQQPVERTQTPVEAPEAAGGAQRTGDTSTAADPKRGLASAESGIKPDAVQPPEFRFRPIQQPTGDSPGRVDDARRAYWSGDTNGAIALYQGFLRNSPDDPQARGELGTIYYKIGRMQEAAAEFQTAAMLLIERREVADARRMIDALAAVDPAHARQLQRQLVDMAAR